MHVSELFTDVELATAITDGLVSMRKHPEFELYIYNYTPKAQYSREWNKVTINCRGLIVDGAGTIVARPFKKFFNYGEEERIDFDLSPDTEVEVLDKADGSLLIFYPTPDGGFDVSTRGSFESEQAQWARNYLRNVKKLVGISVETMKSTTYLAEVICPESKVVLDYGDFEGIIGLAEVDIETGNVFTAKSRPFFDRVVDNYGVMTFADALTLPERENAEGLVLRVDNKNHAKYKYGRYVELHKIVTGLNERTIWEALLEGSADDLIAGLPDEFYKWANDVKYSLTVEKMIVADSVVHDHMSLVESLPEGYTRKEFAQKAIQYENKSALFLLEDGRVEEVVTWAWNQIRP